MLDITELLKKAMYCQKYFAGSASLMELGTVAMQLMMGVLPHTRLQNTLELESASWASCSQKVR